MPVVRTFAAMLADRAANITIVVAVCTPIFLAVLALGFEISQWYMLRNALQNAADSAAVSAATNGGASYDVEARAVAAQYGFVDSVDNVTVTATDTAPCPSGGAKCYQVTISKLTPLYLSQIVGFRGNATVNGQHMIAVSSASAAAKITEKREYCVLALAGLPGHSNNEGFRCNGCPKADLSGCNIMSNNTATCNGHTTLADVGDAYSTNNGCGIEQNSNRPLVDDPYEGLAANIPSNPCGGVYPQAPVGRNDPPLPLSNQWSGTKAINGTLSVCGDVLLTGDVSISNTTGDGAVLVIWNGRLDTDGNTLRTSNGYLTIVFAGTNGSYTHAPMGGGELNFSAPRTGPWSGMAIYQAPNLTSGVDVSEAGNTPTWNITGMVYLPYASVTFSGAINKSATNGESCFAMVIDNMRVNGTGFTLASCAQAGLTLPASEVTGRGQLVN